MIEVKLPELSASMTEATLVSWFKSVGETVQAGDVLAEIETDKSSVELEAECAGVLAEILVPEGTEGIAVGTVLARLKEIGEIAAVEASPVDVPPRSTKDLAKGVDRQLDVSEESPAPRAAFSPRATPLARRMAAQANLDLTTLTGSGSSGRIVREDVERALGAVPLPPMRLAIAQPESTSDGAAPFREERLSLARRTAAERLAESKRSVPHFYLDVECDVERLLELHGQLKARRGSTSRPLPTLNDLLVRATALALLEVPAANVEWRAGSLRVYERVDVSVAVATDRGLVTPVVRGAERKSLGKIALELRDLIARAQQGLLQPREYCDGTVTLSNLGMYGVRRLFPILNPPQACILGIGAIEPRAVVRDGEIAARRCAVVTLAADHRALDGAIGAELLAAFRTLIENPISLLL